MKLQDIMVGCTNFITNEILPTATPAEVIAINAMPYLNIMDMNVIYDKIANNPFLKNSQVLSENGDINVEILHQIAVNTITSLGGSKTYDGYEIDLGFVKVMLFKGVIINKPTIDQLFKHIYAVGGNNNDRPSSNLN